MGIKPQANFWIEKDGEVVLSTWRVALLEAIDETGSISAAAERMNVPYRIAWQKIHEMEERLGVSFLETQTGGVGGGGARLTPEGRAYVQRFRQFTAGLNDLVQQRFKEAFPDEG